MPPACSVVPARASTRATTSSATSCAERAVGVSSVWLVVCCGSVKLFLFSSPCLQGRTRHRRRPRYFAAGRAGAPWVASARERAGPLLHRAAGLPRRAPAAARPPGRPRGRGRDRRRHLLARPRRPRARACCSTTSPRRRPTGDLLDLGCGWGPVALTLALESPAAHGLGGRRQRARARPRRGATPSGSASTNVRAVRPDEVPDDVRVRRDLVQPADPRRQGGAARDAAAAGSPPRAAAARRTSSSARTSGRTRCSAGSPPSSAWTSSGPRAPRGSACSPCATDERLAVAAHHHLEHVRADLHGRVRVARRDHGDADRLRRAGRRRPVRVRVRRAAGHRRRRHGRGRVRGATAADPRTPLLVAVGLFTAGILVAGAAPSMGVLVAGRLLQGFGGGAMTVALYVVVARLYPAMLHPRVFAGFAAAWVLPSLVGPAGAGAVAQHLGWRWVFLGVALLVVPVTLVLLPAVRRIGRPRRPARRHGAAGSRGPCSPRRPCSGSTSPPRSPSRGRCVVAVGTGVRRPRRAARAGARRHAARGARAARASSRPAASSRGRSSGAEVYLPYLLTERYGFSPTTAGIALTFAGVAWAGDVVAAGPARRPAAAPHGRRPRLGAGRRRGRRRARSPRPRTCRRRSRSRLDARRRRDGPGVLAAHRAGARVLRPGQPGRRTARRCRSRTRSARPSPWRSRRSRSPPPTAAPTPRSPPPWRSPRSSPSARAGRAPRRPGASGGGHHRRRRGERAAQLSERRHPGRAADDVAAGVEHQDGRRHVDAEPLAERQVVGDVEVDVRDPVGRSRPHARRRSRVARQGAQNVLENCTTVARSPSGTPRSSGVRRTAVSVRRPAPRGRRRPPRRAPRDRRARRARPAGRSRGPCRPGTSTSQTSGAPAPAQVRTASAAAHAPVPQDRVSPTPRSCTRMRTPADERAVRGPVLAQRDDELDVGAVRRHRGDLGRAREVGGGQLVLVPQREDDVRVADVDAQPGARDVEPGDGHLRVAHRRAPRRRRPAGTSGPCPPRTRRRRRSRRAPGPGARAGRRRACRAPARRRPRPTGRAARGRPRTPGRRCRTSPRPTRRRCGSP